MNDANAIEMAIDLLGDILVDLEMTAVDPGAYIDCAKEKAKLAIAVLEAEKPAGDLSDALIVAKQIAMKSYQDFDDDAKIVKSFAGSYHLSECAKCKKLKNSLVSHTRDRDAEIDGIAEKE